MLHIKGSQPPGCAAWYCLMAPRRVLGQTKWHKPPPYKGFWQESGVLSYCSWSLSVRGLGKVQGFGHRSLNRPGTGIVKVGNTSRTVLEEGNFAENNIRDDNIRDATSSVRAITGSERYSARTGPASLGRKEPEGPPARISVSWKAEEEYSIPLALKRRVREVGLVRSSDQ
jgi:hypothetical protein